MTVYLNIGSNLGNRKANILAAVSKIEEALHVKCLLSHFFTSQPWGYESPHQFVNVGVAFECDLPPLTLLHHLQAIEKSVSTTAHRDLEGNYRDREIDIDIIAIDKLVLHTPELEVPHPLMSHRDFVLIPLQELNPSWKHPLLGFTPAEMIDNLRKSKN